MNDGRIILEQGKFQILLRRLSHQLVEDHGTFAETCLVGLQPRGIHLGNRIHEQLSLITENDQIDFGKLDITFYRDDFRSRKKPLQASQMEMDFLVEDRKVILIDDVLYTGRSVAAALNALQHYGRAKSVELLTLIDRRFNRHLPVHPDYTGMTIDALDEAYVRVEWEEMHGADRVILFSAKTKA